MVIIILYKIKIIIIYFLYRGQSGFGKIRKSDENGHGMCGINRLVLSAIVAEWINFLYYISI